MLKEIFAVIWSDFGVPLNLKYESADEAIAKARDMHAKSELAHIRLGHLHAVRVDASNNLHILWDATAA